MNYSVNDYFAKNSSDSSEVKFPIILINDVAKLFCEKMDRPLQDGKQLTKTEGIILMYLYDNPGMTQLDISKATHLQPPTVSIKLKKLESDGYIRRDADKYDRRAFRVFLTEKGNSLYSSSYEKANEGQKQLLQGISADEIEALAKTLERIIENANK